MFYGESEDITDVINRIVEDKVSNFIEQKVEEKVQEHNKLVVLFSNEDGAQKGTLSDSIDNYDYIIVIHGMAITGQKTPESDMEKVKKGEEIKLALHFSTANSYIYGWYAFKDTNFSTYIESDTGEWSNRYGIMEVIGIKK